MKPILLGSTALICVTVLNTAAMAACSNTTPANGETVVCTGNSSTLVDAGTKTGVTVVLEKGASITTNGFAINLGTNSNAIIGGNIDTPGYTSITLNNGGNTVTLNGDAHISALGGFAMYGTGDNQHVSLNDHSSMTDLEFGVDLHGNSNTVSMNGKSSMANADFGITLNGDSDTISMNSNSSMKDVEFGIYLTGNLGTISMNGNSSMTNTQFGIGLLGNSNTVEMNGNSSIKNADFGIDLNDNDNTLQLNGNTLIDANTVGVGIRGAGAKVTIGSGVHISASGNFSEGISVLGSAGTIINAGTIFGKTFGILETGDADIVNTGTIVSGSGTAITFGAGNNSLTLGTGSHIVGSIDGGNGNDTVSLTGTGSADNQFIHFETLNMNGGDWSLSGDSAFTTMDIQHGRLAINGTISALTLSVQQPGILGGSGSFTGNITSVGAIAPGNSVGTLTVNGNVNQTGGSFDAQFDKHGIDKLNVIGGAANISGGTILNVIPDGGGGANGVILHADNGITVAPGSGIIHFQGNGAATAMLTANDLSVVAIDGTSVEGTDFAAGQAGLDFADAVDDETVAGFAPCGDNACDRDDKQKHLWMKAFGRFGAETAEEGNRPFDYRIAGTAMGGDMEIAKNFRLGVAAGYSNTDETLNKDAASSDINTTQLSLYARYEIGHFFLAGQLGGGWQRFDQSRDFAGNVSADSNANAWLFNGGVQAGASFSFPHGWRLTPTAGISYQHQWADGYTEHGAGAGNAKIDAHQADAMRLKAQLLLEQDYQLTDMTITPHFKVGAQRQIAFGGHADGTFLINGSDFSLELANKDQMGGLFGAGVQVGFNSGLATYVDYDGSYSTQGVVHAVTGGLRYSW